MRGHRFALTKDQLMMADLIDITMMANRGKGPKPPKYDRGFDLEGVARSKKPTASQEDVFKNLEALGHARPKGERWQA